jgi:hypothetical protein
MDPLLRRGWGQAVSVKVQTQRLVGRWTLRLVGLGLSKMPAFLPISPTYFSRVYGVVYKWLWVPVRTLDLRSATPASLLDIE